MTGPDVGVDVTDTPSMRADWLQADAEDHPTELLASKPRAGHPDLPMRSGAWIDPAIPTLELANARDGAAVHLRLLRRDERELVARFFAGLAAESRRRRFLKPMARLPEAMLRRLVDVDDRRHVAVVAAVNGQCVGTPGTSRWPTSRARPRSRSPSPTATRAAASGGCWSRPCGRWPSAAGLTSLVHLVDPTNRPALRLLRSLGVELALRDGLVEGGQRLPGRPLLEASSGSGPASGEWPCRAGPSTRQLPDPHPQRSLDPSCAWEG
jgi:hypothetical protein